MSYRSEVYDYATAYNYIDSHLTSKFQQLSVMIAVPSRGNGRQRKKIFAASPVHTKLALGVEPEWSVALVNSIELEESSIPSIVAKRFAGRV
jgi:hypothetical protein